MKTKLQSRRFKQKKKTKAKDPKFSVQMPENGSAVDYLTPTTERLKKRNQKPIVPADFSSVTRKGDPQFDLGLARNQSPHTIS